VTQDLPRSGSPTEYESREPALRRENLLVLAGTFGLGLLGLLTLFGVGLPKILLGLLLFGGASLAFLRPEMGLFALVLNALLGFTHLASLPRVGPFSVPVAFEIVLVIAVLYQALVRGRPLFIASPQHILIGALTVWMLVSLLASGNLGAENLEAIRNLYLVRMLTLLLITNLLLTGDALKRLMIVLMTANAGLLVTSFLVREGFFGADRQTYSDTILRTTGIVHNSNTLAFDLTTMLIFCVASFFYVRSPLLRLVTAALAGLDLLAILTTLSRSGFVSLCAVILFLFYRLKGNLRFVIFLACLAVAVTLLLPSGLLFRFSRIHEIQDVDRVKFAQVGLNTTLHNPVFGVGFGNYTAAFNTYNNAGLKEPDPTHNMYLSLTSQMGIPALAIYIAIFVVLWRRMRSMQADLKRVGGQASFLYQFGWAVQAFLVNLFVFGTSGDVEFEYSVFIVLGFGMLLYREHQRRLRVLSREGSPALVRGGIP